MNYTKQAQELLQSVTEGGRSKELHVSAAIGAAVASRLQLPGSDIENLNMWFRSICQIETMEYVSKVNEVVVVDTDAVMSYTKAFMSVRIAAAYPSKAILTTRTSALNRLTGVATALDQATMEAIEKNSFAFSVIYNRVNAYLDSTVLNA